jgi:HK97 family phage major capsid protein
MNPAWFCSKLCAEVVFGRLCAIAGGNTTETLSNGKVGRQYLGYPIVVSQKLPKVLTDLSDQAMLFFGDLALAATLGDRGDLEVFPSDHRYMDTNQIGIRGTQRYDINVHDVGDTTTGNAGPIVALVGE